MRNSKRWMRVLLVIAAALPLIFEAAPAQANDLVCVNILTVYVLGEPHPLVYEPVCEVPHDDFTVPHTFGSPTTCTPDPLTLGKVCFYIVVHRPSGG